MRIWIDAHLSPALAAWINQSFEAIEAQSLRALGLRDANDRIIFEQARQQNVTVMSKDYDFLKLIDQYGPPPYLIWINCGNTSNAQMREILTKSLNKTIRLIKKGEPIVEISDQY